MANHLKLGISTGAIAEDRGDWTRLTRRCRSFSSAAIEFAALGGDELHGLSAFLQRQGQSFRFVSVHAPTKRVSSSPTDLAKALVDLPRWVDAIVLHPDTLQHTRAFGVLGRRLVVENMDSRKPFGTTTDDLLTIYAAFPKAKFCLDLAHAYSLDPSMGLAHELLDAFRVRLSHVHVSSLSTRGGHVALTPTDEAAFEPVLRRCIDVPWILEAVRRDDLVAA
ncbi:hypothetical protein [Patulibacter sp. SYSU D01012]|uniref:hypothetical protein n=1 Tax=Patulibacter sp. SYSU D01012 TaxID=2817381 RepID=UPI001B3155F8|nr:hypothetical protein [Patulibacter sp. SYSU D01012]